MGTPAQAIGSVNAMGGLKSALPVKKPINDKAGISHQLKQGSTCLPTKHLITLMGYLITIGSTRGYYLLIAIIADADHGVNTTTSLHICHSDPQHTDNPLPQIAPDAILFVYTTNRHHSQIEHDPSHISFFN